jgi:predicted outer membrane protein
MGEMLTEEGLFNQAEQMLSTFDKKSLLNGEALAHLMNSFDRLYTRRHQEYVAISLNYHELNSQYSKRDAEFRKLVDKYERLRVAGETVDQGAVAKLMSAIGRFLPIK